MSVVRLSLKYRRALTVVMAASGLVACAAPPVIPPPLAMQSLAGLYAEKSLAAPASSWPSDHWWLDYRDPQLTTLISQALADSPTLASAGARVRKADALAGAAGAALSPSLEAKASEATVKQSYYDGFPAAYVPKGYKESGRATLDLTYELDFFGKNRAALAAATSETQAAMADAAQARLELSTDVAAAYGDLAKGFADRDAAEQAIAVRRQTADLTRQRLAQGLEDQAAAEQAEASLATAKAQLAEVNETLDLDRNRLAALVGAGPDRGLAVGRPNVGVPSAFGLPNTLKTNLIGRRPDVIAARLRAEAQAHKIKEAKAEFYPNVNLSAYVGSESLGLDMLTKAGSSIGSIGPAISLPLFEGGRLRANYRGARADYDAAVASYNETLTQALKDVADAAVSARALNERLSQSRRAYDAAETAHDIALQRYRGGLSTYLEVLTAEDAMIADARIVADLKSRAFTLDVALVRALGGGFQAA